MFIAALFTTAKAMEATLMSISRSMDKENVVHIHNESVLIRWMSLGPVIQSKVSLKDKIYIHINAYIYNLGKRY